MFPECGTEAVPPAPTGATQGAGVAELAGRSASPAGHLRPSRSAIVVLPFIVVFLAALGGCSPSPPKSRSAAPLPSSTLSHSTLPAPTTAPSAPGPCGWAAAPPARYQHVIWIWMENHSWPQVLGDRAAAPYEVSLAAQCATATAYRDVGSPSLPNYIGATSGGTQGMSDDASPPSHPLTVDNLFRQVRAAGGTERSYQEDMTQPCQASAGGRYAVKHNPAAYYVGPNGEDRVACQADDVPFPQLAADLGAGNLPTFAFVTPNLCHDTHDCPVATGDAWLAGELPSILTSPVYRQGTTAILVVWDEYSPVPNLMIGPAVHPGTVVSQPFDHFAVLGATEELLGLPGRLGAAAQAPSLRALFNL